MTRTTLQRAKVLICTCFHFNRFRRNFVLLKVIGALFSLQDAQDLGISIELLPLSRPDEEFNVSLFFAV
jgi:hypothetical protein